MSVSSTQSLTVTIFEFDWKPRWVMIISENLSYIENILQMCYNPPGCPTYPEVVRLKGGDNVVSFYEFVVAVMVNVASYYVIKCLDFVITLIIG